jgi:hypothetical protein
MMMMMMMVSHFSVLNKHANASFVSPIDVCPHLFFGLYCAPDRGNLGPLSAIMPVFSTCSPHLYSSHTHIKDKNRLRESY